MTVSHDQFLADFAELSAIGATGRGGVDRQAATAADAAARRWLAGLLAANGFEVVYDRVGNQFGLRGWVPDAPAVLVGSHLDSQPTAGRFDGAYGVLAAAHAAFAVSESIATGRLTPRLNLAVVNWFNEEGSRFQPSMMGSACYTRAMAPAAALATQDRAGQTVAEALAAQGMLGDWDGPEAACAAEIHVEQGRELEDTGYPIGLVTSAWAARKYSIEITGEQAHSGSAIMADRRDALYGAALVTVAIRALADASNGKLHSGIGQMEVYPNSPVVVASRVKLLADLRSADVELLNRAAAELEERLAEAGKQARVRVDAQLTHAWDMEPYAPGGVELARRCADRLGLRHRPILTIAGHDSTNLKRMVPTVMLFVPSAQGVSHSEAEFTGDADLLAGLDLLTEVVGELIGGAAGDLPPS
ncbi:MAG: allantoate amidohydrolase [Bifidobacteriaceae bacterium]|jgi:N-carbamoyl-L-amino-acid hydrolase|nr:allantoate amidohydrolase [Bifidobacteriaceae bacterium]